MERTVEISYKIEEFCKDEDLKVMLEQTTKWTLTDSIQLKKPVWSDEWYVPRHIHTYEVTAKPGFELLAEHLINMIINYEIIN